METRVSLPCEFIVGNDWNIQTPHPLSEHRACISNVRTPSHFSALPATTSFLSSGAMKLKHGTLLFPQHTFTYPWTVYVGLSLPPYEIERGEYFGALVGKTKWEMNVEQNNSGSATGDKQDNEDIFFFLIDFDFWPCTPLILTYKVQFEIPKCLCLTFSFEEKEIKAS